MQLLMESPARVLPHQRPYDKSPMIGAGGSKVLVEAHSYTRDAPADPFAEDLVLIQGE